MFSVAAAIGFISLALLLASVSYFLRQLGAGEVVRLLLGAAAVCLTAALIGTLL